MIYSSPNIPEIRERRASQVKSATPDLLIVEDLIPDSVIVKLLLEDVAGQELLLLSRHDTIRGQEVSYRAISNAGDLEFKYSSETILFATESFKNYFRNFPILLESVVPELDENENSPNGYVDLTTGDVILEFKDLKNGQQIEHQALSSANVFDDTIY